MSGPISGGSHGYPFWSTTRDLAADRYVEREFFLGGTARSYVPAQPLSTVTDGRWDSTPTGASADYNVRMLVRRPADPAKFNGKVFVEWLNVTEGWEIDPIETAADDELIRQGYAIVGVGAQSVGTNYLKTWDPARYGSLVHPGDSFSYDIFSQAGKAVAHPQRGAVAPLGSLTSKIRVMVAGGQSQSAGRLFTYINAVHPTAKVYDGFLVQSFLGGGTSLSQAPQPSVPVPGGADARIRTDIDEPVLVYDTETDVPGIARGIHQQADDDGFRLWEYTGTAHADRFWFEASAPVRVKAGLVGPPLQETPYGLLFSGCGSTPINEGPSKYAARAAVNAVSDWSLNPKHAPAIGHRISLTIPATGTATVDRDPTTGIALGGIRLPEISVPIETLQGQGSNAGGFCFLFGKSDPWDHDTDPFDGQVIDNPAPAPEPDPADLYGSVHRYVKKVRMAANHAKSDGFLLQRDVAEIVHTAKHATF